MMTSTSMPISAAGSTPPKTPATSDMVDRLAQEMRATGDRDLPLSFYVEQAKRKLARSQGGNGTKTAKAASIPAVMTSSVFHCWAMPEQG